MVKEKDRRVLPEENMCRRSKTVSIDFKRICRMRLNNLEVSANVLLISSFIHSFVHFNK
jgi:hypothetical protein